jgi:AcrR family transcriptional regulator
MIIPAPAEAHATPPAATACWTALDHDGKRERLLQAAGEVFAAQGLDASMPTVAAAAGAGVASVYRQFPSKRDLLAVLVARRLDQIVTAATVARRQDSDHFSALVEMLWTFVERDSRDDFLGEARIAVADHPEVVRAAACATRALDRLLSAARAEGRLRADATTLDLKLLFAATRAAKRLEPAAWPRMLELLIDALERPSGVPGDHRPGSSLRP